MSSDSDLDFESADEDADFTSNTKVKDGSKASTSGEKKCPQNSEENTAIEEINKDSSNVQGNSSEKNSEDPQSTADCDAVRNKEKSEGTIDKTKACVDENVTEKLVSEDSTLDPDTSSPISGNVEVQKETKRVILRLEKKKQQKSQMSKESPVEKEKPEDLVNILEDNYKQQQSSWGFRSWGTSLLSTAASSVSTFSSQVSQGLGSVMETVESTLGAPPPEELASILNEKRESSIEEEVKEAAEQDPKAGLLPDISSWTKVLESTGSKVLSGGLDTLEFIGKKTMDILTEGDPGLRKKRSAFNNAENLSELLREIKARADEEDKAADSEEGNLHYSQIFDDKQGLVHLEALEMLSKQSQAKLQRLLMRHSKDTEIKKRLEEIRSICEDIPSLDEPTHCDEFEDFETVFKKHSLELSLPLNVDNILKVQKHIDTTLKSFGTMIPESCTPPKEIFQSGICGLAEFTAKCIETFHKVAELILVQASVDSDLEHCATNLTGLTSVMCVEVNNISTKYHNCLEASFKVLSEPTEETVDVTTMATNLYLEASNSNNYIQDAYQMLVPVLQVRLLETID